MDAVPAPAAPTANDGLRGLGSGCVAFKQIACLRTPHRSWHRNRCRRAESGAQRVVLPPSDARPLAPLAHKHVAALARHLVAAVRYQLALISSQFSLRPRQLALHPIDPWLIGYRQQNFCQAVGVSQVQHRPSGGGLTNGLIPFMPGLGPPSCISVCMWATGCGPARLAAVVAPTRSPASQKSPCTLPLECRRSVTALSSV